MLLMMDIIKNTMQLMNEKLSFILKNYKFIGTDKILIKNQIQILNLIYDFI